MKVRLFDKQKDYETVATWWKAQGWPPMPISSLPKIGLIIDGYCACFIYSTDSDIALLEYLISNPKTDKQQRRDAIKTLLNEGLNVCKDLGFRIALTFVGKEHVVQTYKNHGFSVCDKDMTHLVKVL